MRTAPITCAGCRRKDGCRPDEYRHGVTRTRRSWAMREALAPRTHGRPILLLLLIK